MSALCASLLACALKTTLLLALAALVCASARRASAAMRHRVWALAVGCTLLLPVLQFGIGRSLVSAAAGSAAVWSVPLFPAAAPLNTTAPAFVVIAGPAPLFGMPWLLWIWSAGAALMALRLGAGLISLLRVSRRARPCNDVRLLALMDHCQRRLGTPRRVILKITDAPHWMPCTWGWLRPVVLLPASCADWPEPRRRLVLLHELAHIERRDWPLGLLAEVLRTLYWCHPLAWLAVRNLRHESERACDDAVLAAGENAARYAGELLQLARSAHYFSTALAVARPSNLARRITAMLDTTINRRRPTRRAMLLTTTAALLLLLPLAALRAPAQNIAGQLSGTVTDPRGAPVASATVILSNTRTQARQMTATDASGAFVFDALPAGEYSMRVLKPGFAAAARPIVLETARDLVQNVSLSMGAVSEQVRVSAVGSAPAPSAAAPTSIQVASSVQASALTLRVVPTYPQHAKAAGVQGAVELEAIIGRDGVPASLQVMNAADPDLARAAVEAVSQWRYRATLLNGEPIDVQTNITVNFTLLP